jgi:hypothetical protein
MVRWMKAPQEHVGRSILLRHVRVFHAASILLVFMNPPFGAAQEQINQDPMPGPQMGLPISPGSRVNAGALSGHDPAQSVHASDRSPTSRQRAIVYPFELTEKHHLTPSFSLNYDDAGGEAGKNRTADIRLTYGYLGDPLVLVVNTLIERAGYDKKDSAFGKTTSDEGYGVSASVYYTNPRDWSLSRGNAIRFFATGSYYYTGSKGDVPSQESVSGAAGISLEW